MVLLKQNEKKTVLMQKRIYGKFLLVFLFVWFLSILVLCVHLSSVSSSSIFFSSSSICHQFFIWLILCISYRVCVWMCICVCYNIVYNKRRYHQYCAWHNIQQQQHQPPIIQPTKPISQEDRNCQWKRTCNCIRKIMHLLSAINEFVYKILVQCTMLIK